MLRRVGYGLVVAIALALAVSFTAPHSNGTLVERSPLGQVPMSPAMPVDASTGPRPSSSVATSIPNAVPTAAHSTSTATSAIRVVATALRVPALGIDLPIYEGDGTNATIGKAAHYPGTAWPGGGTLIYIYAHARDGMFIALWDARPGELIILDLANGSSADYIVTRIDPNVAWNDMSVLRPTSTEILRLQTCTGNGLTVPRYIVEAVPSDAASARH